MTQAKLPQSRVTFVFTDIEGSSRLTRLLDEEKPGLYVEKVLNPHNDLLLPLVEQNRGEIVQFTGDGYLFAFQSADDAVSCMVAFQKQLRAPGIAFVANGKAERLSPKRNRYRRLGLKAAYRLVVPSERLEKIARRHWGKEALRIPNGVPVATFAKPPEAEAIPGFERQGDEVVIGTVAGLRAVKNLPRLVRALARMTNRQTRLVIVGEGPESERIAAEARARGVASRVLMPGFLGDPARWIGQFDIFALSSDSEQFPISLIEAMAAGLPAVATAVGDVPDIVAEDNKPLIVDRDDEAAFAAALDSLADQPHLRKAIGAANREKAAALYDERDMIAAYARLYGEAIGRAEAFGLLT